MMIGSGKMAQLHTPAEAAEILRIRESWLRAKAAARAIQGSGVFRSYPVLGGM